MRRIHALAWAIMATGLAAAAPLAVSGTAQATETMTVVLDQARVLPLPADVSTIVVGNPAIADATTQNGSLMVVTGKGYGLTNLMMLDAKGRTVAEHLVNVVAPRNSTVTVFRGGKAMDRLTYACAPRCEGTIVLGDSKDYFDNMKKQAEDRNKLAGGGTAQ
ncbi:pilus assembly protein N-terminal domain-containing protein [Blastochloris sulfoviridis]|nr:pilus assembly protein N-terminal domain-containing protein [Blastochloris sulfoviridis]